MIEWLLSELRSAVTPSEAARFALDLSNQSVSLVERRANGLRERGSVAYGAPDFDERVETMRAIVARGRGGEARVDIMLPEELILHRVETFPSEARGALRDEAWWRLDSITPYRPETLCYDVSLIGIEPTTGFLDVSIAIAPRDIVAEAVGYAKSWGFAPQRITSTPFEGFVNGPLLLQASNARQETQSLRRSATWLAAAAILLIIVGAWRGVAERRLAAAALETRQSEAEAAMGALDETRLATLAFVSLATRPIEKRRGERPALEWLDAIAEALPPGARAERIVMTGGAVRIEGVTDAPEAVLTAVASAAAFTEARYADALAPVAGGADRRRFAIEARLTSAEPDE